MLVDYRYEAVSGVDRRNLYAIGYRFEEAPHPPARRARNATRAPA